MSSEYALKFMPQAKRDLEEIYSYISTELSNEPAAIKLIDKIEQALRSLKKSPKRCPISDNPELAIKGYRKCVIANYIALYKTDDEQKQIIVTKVFYGRRNYANLGLY